MLLYEVVYYGSNGDANAEDTLYLVKAPDFQTAVAFVQRNSSPRFRGATGKPAVVHEIGLDFSGGGDPSGQIIRGPYFASAYNFGWRRWTRKWGKTDYTDEWEETTSPAAARVLHPLQLQGWPKATLQEALRAQGVLFNAAADTLFASDLFRPAATPCTITTVALTVADLGFTDDEGVPMAAILERAAALGLVPCPLETAAYLRLDYLDQPEGFVGKPERPHAAPYGSLTVLSPPLSNDDAFPKGFYLRRISGALWLRGYTSSADHLWSPHDHLLLHRP